MKQFLMVHHSLTADSGTVSWQAIRHYHTSWRHEGQIVTEAQARNLRAMGKHVTAPWDDIGYNLGVERVGDRYEMLVGRPLLARAAAAYQQGMNARAVHVCFVGNFDLVPPEDSMLWFAAPHLASICDALRIPITPERVIGHSRVAPYKTCPGRRFDLSHLIGMMRGVV